MTKEFNLKLVFNGYDAELMNYTCPSTVKTGSILGPTVRLKN